MSAIKKFFLPSDDSKTLVRVLPLVVVAIVVVIFFVSANAVWEVTNSVKFCGLTCHTMPPQYVTHENSAHTNVTCEDCHMGRDKLSVMVQRKIKYSWQTGSAMVLGNYEYPIIAKNMAPAREACENCHKPEVFSADKLVEIKHFAEDAENSATITSLVIKTGGGTSREGLGYGIHWHIENPVYYYATDPEQQDIPYVVVTAPGGQKTEYVNVESNFDASKVQPDQLKQMDCITCHNRTAHSVGSPQTIVDTLMTNGRVSTDIPDIKQKALQVFSQSYPDVQSAKDAIAGLDALYRQEYADFYTQNGDLITTAVEALQSAYADANFPDQKMDWKTHPNNIGHSESPGCFRCHDGKHLSAEKEAVRLECNLCHSIPVVTGPDKFVTNIEISRGPEPDSHLDTSWISRHHVEMNSSCSACHSVKDPGGVSNQSFCSNSACHGGRWDFAGFDAPAVRQILDIHELPELEPEDDVPAPTATPDTSAPAGTPTGPVTFENSISAILAGCTGCHGVGGQKGVNLTSYQAVMTGGSDGPIVIPGDPQSSILVKVQTGSKPHFMQLSPKDLQTLIDWISAGALEK